MKIEISGDLRREMQQVATYYPSQLKNALEARESALPGISAEFFPGNSGVANVIPLSSRPGVIIPALVAGLGFLATLFTHPR